MSLNVNPGRQTGSLPIQPASPIASPAAISLPTPAQPSLSESPTIQSSAPLSSPVQGESRTSVQLVDTGYKTDPHRGRRLENRLYERLGVQFGSDNNAKGTSYNPNRGAESLDFTMAKVAQERYAQPIAKLQSVLQTIHERLPGLGHPDLPPLSQAETAELNQTLEAFGLSTDGKNLFNLNSPLAGAGNGNGVACATCSKHELEMVMDLVSAAQEKNLLASNPADAFLPASIRSAATPATAAANPANRFAPTSQRADFIADLANIANLKRDALLGIITQSETRIEQSRSRMAEWQLKQQASDQQVTVITEQANQVREEAVAQQSNFANLTTSRDMLYSSSTIGQAVATANVETINLGLAPVGLSVSRSGTGQPAFYQNGQVISEAAFRIALDKAVVTEASKTADKRNDLLAIELSLQESRDNSANISLQLGKERDLLTQELTTLNSVKSNTSGELTADDLSRIDRAVSSAQQAVDQINTQLSTSEKIRQKTARAMLMIQGALGQLDKLLDMHKLPAIQKAEATETTPLNLAADEVGAQLETAQAMPASELQKLAEDWLKTSEDALEFRNLNRAKLSQQSQQRESFERATQVLRENLSYHENQLEKLDKASHEKLSQALQDHLQATRQLLSD